MGRGLRFSIIDSGYQHEELILIGSIQFNKDLLDSTPILLWQI